MAKKSKKRGKKNWYQNILTRSNHVNCYSFFWVAFRIKVWLICWRTVKVEISSNSSNNGVGVKRLVVLGLREPENMKEDRFFFFFSLLLSKTLQIHSTKLLSSPKCKTLSNNLTNSPVSKCSKQLPFTRLIRESN